MGVIVYGNQIDVVYVQDSDTGASENFVICDDCREAYLEPAYYSYGDDDLLTETDPVTGATTEVPHECMHNLCPACADQLEPDDEDDPRRPSA